MQPGTKAWRDDAESDLIDLVRRNDVQNFTVTITCRDGRWQVEGVDHDQDHPGLTLRGEGSSFADAWHDQTPLWAKEN